MRASVSRSPRSSAAVPCATSRPDVHDPDVGADLLDLGEQVAGDQHGGAVAGQRAAIRLRTSRVPCGSSPLVGSSRTIRSLGVSSAAAMASRWHMPSE